MITTVEIHPPENYRFVPGLVVAPNGPFVFGSTDWGTIRSGAVNGRGLLELELELRPFAETSFLVRGSVSNSRQTEVILPAGTVRKLKGYRDGATGIRRADRLFADVLLSIVEALDLEVAPEVSDADT